MLVTGTTIFVEEKSYSNILSSLNCIDRVQTPNVTIYVLSITLFCYIAR